MSQFTALTHNNHNNIRSYYLRDTYACVNITLKKRSVTSLKIKNKERTKHGIFLNKRNISMFTMRLIHNTVVSF